MRIALHVDALTTKRGGAGRYRIRADEVRIHCRNETLGSLVAE
jgi:hypothetical protein